MTDCYRILGVHPAASAAEVRAAYLAKMKLLHPDAAPDAGADEMGASDITYAYWRLRDPERRADHDRQLAKAAGDHGPRTSPRGSAVAKTPPPHRRPGRGGKRGAGRKTAPHSKGRPARLGSRLQPFRAAVGVTVCALAAVSFVLTFSYLQPQGQAHERDLRAVDTGPPRTLKPARVPSADAKRAAGIQFRSILAQSGHDAAHLYSRQCLFELGARPSLAMLDYCLAFDGEGASWEENRAHQEDLSRYFTADQRLARYRDAARDLREGTVHDALLNEADVLAAGHSTDSL